MGIEPTTSRFTVTLRAAAPRLASLLESLLKNSTKKNQTTFLTKKKTHFKINNNNNKKKTPQTH